MYRRTDEHSTSICTWMAVILISLCTQSFALPDDSTRMVNLSAGSANINQQNRTGIYLHDVTLDQGTTHIRAEEAITRFNDKNQLVLAVIKGNQTTQAHYWTLPATDKPPVHAWADTIKYYPEQHLVELTGNARVEQGENSFAAAEIKYDTLAQHVVSQGSNNSRTTIIIHPGKDS